MCLAVPGQIESRFESDGLPMGCVNFGGVRKTICLVYVPEADVGDYVIVHVGFALHRIDEQSAIATLATFAELAASQKELDS